MLLWLLLLTSAGSTALTPPTVTIDQGASASVEEGATTQLTAATTGNPTPTVAWASDDTNVATVNASSGLVTGVAAGSCTITATATNSEGSAQDTLALTVTARPSGVMGAPPPRRGRWLEPGTGAVLVPTVPQRPVAATGRALGSDVVEVSSAARATSQVRAEAIGAARGSDVARVYTAAHAGADGVWNPTEGQLREVLMALKLS